MVVAPEMAKRWKMWRLLWTCVCPTPPSHCLVPYEADPTPPLLPASVTPPICAVIRNKETSKNDFVFYADRLIRLVSVTPLTPRWMDGHLGTILGGWLSGFKGI
jgi:hypothetical protein